MVVAAEQMHSSISTFVSQKLIAARQSVGGARVKHGVPIVSCLLFKRKSNRLIKFYYRATRLTLYWSSYIIILPGFGIISQVIPHFANKPIFGYLGMVVGPLKQNQFLARFSGFVDKYKFLSEYQLNAGKLINQHGGKAV